MVKPINPTDEDAALLAAQVRMTKRLEQLNESNIEGMTTLTEAGHHELVDIATLAKARTDLLVEIVFALLPIDQERARLSFETAYEELVSQHIAVALAQSAQLQVQDGLRLVVPQEGLVIPT